MKFTYIKKFDAQADEDLEKWEHFLAPYVAALNSREFREASILNMLHEDSKSFPLNFRSIRDDQDNLQSAALIFDQAEQSSGHILLIRWIASAPWNHRGNDKRKRKGFGELMLKQIVKESKAKGHGGRVIAISSPDAQGFYLRFGFTPDESGEGKMILTPKAANRFLRSP